MTEMGTEYFNSPTKICGFMNEKVVQNKRGGTLKNKTIFSMQICLDREVQIYYFQFTPSIGEQLVQRCEPDALKLTSKMAPKFRTSSYGY